MGFKQEDFNRLVLDNKVLGLFEKKKVLKSKRESNWYVNWRLDDLFLLEQVADHVVEFTKDLGIEVDTFYGVPEGATRLALLTQYTWAKQSENYGPGSHVIPMGRGNPKEHGVAKDKYFVGTPRGKVVILEDVTTTGGSLLNTISQLKELEGIEIIAAYGLTNRMEKTPIPGDDDEGVVAKFAKQYEAATGKAYEKEMSVAEAVKDAGVQYQALSSGAVLLPRAVKIENPSEEIIGEIKAEFAKYGIVPIDLEGE
ncbi:hypothetical protein KY325_04515 [Candidatus Woesearchaeota archaeon]|nr:hypothetical protein [Candidatus Woesearchaeota archaeon]